MLLTACYGGGVVEQEELDAGSWVVLGTFHFSEVDGEQLSRSIAIPGGGRGFALYVEVEGCAQVARLETGIVGGRASGRVWVPALERGVSCARCAERFSVIAGSGLIVHDPIVPEALDATLRFGRIDCDTLNPLRSERQTSLRAWMRTLPVAREVEPLRLHFVLGPASPWAAGKDSARLAVAVGDLLAGAGLEVDLLQSTEDGSLDAPLEWFEGTPEGPPCAGFKP